MKKLSFLTAALAASLISKSASTGTIARDATINSVLNCHDKLNPEYVLDDVQIKWIRVNPQEFSGVKIEIAQDQGLVFTLGGLSIPPVSSDGKARCVILSPEPHEHNDQAMQILGHEVAHCFYGRWHGLFGSDLDAGEARTPVLKWTPQSRH